VAIAAFLIRSAVKVAIPHLLGGKDEINATFFGVPFAIRNIPFEIALNTTFSF
jgi:hypothetical protein